VSGDEEAVHETLLTELRLLRDKAVLKVSEFGISGVVVWTVERDRNGTPQARQSLPLPAATWSDDPALCYEQRLRPRIGGSRLLIVCSSPDGFPEGFPEGEPDVERPGQMLGELRADRPDARIFCVRTPVAELLRQAIRESPLTRWYELMVLRQSPSGQLVLDSHRLFPPDARRGYRRELRIRCEPSDSNGTVFAVVVRDFPGIARVPPESVVSVRSAVVKPGVYKLTAVLARPGRVEFEGLPATPEAELRHWAEIVETVPDRLHRSPPAHLVCAMEVSGTSERLMHRIDRLEQLIDSVSAADRRLAVSLVTYGPHSFDRREHDEPVRIRAWARSGDAVLAELRELRGRKPPDDEYPWAARLECALAVIAERLTGRLTGRHGHPVLVTAGMRPPFPPQADVRTEILPCPDRQDWRGPLQQLARVPGMAFGALCDQDAEGEIWTQLGRNAIRPVSVLDVPRFAAALRLSGPVQHVPFPVIDEERA
jgi:hypothetical protein